MYNDCDILVSRKSRIASNVCIKSTSRYTHHGCRPTTQADFGKEPPWVMFANELVIKFCERSRADVELQLERWRETFESHGLTIAWTKW